MFPATANQAAESVIPLASIYNPLHKRSDLPVLNYEPVVCKNPDCGAVINPFNVIDLNGQYWICRLCNQRYQLPSQYASMNSDSVPPELNSATGSSVEYVLNRIGPSPPIFLYVVDTSHNDDEENFQALKDALLVSLSLLPENALIGIISFGSMVHVHELSYVAANKTICFNGCKDYSSRKIKESLGFLVIDGTTTGAASSKSAVRVASRFLLPVQQAEFQLTNVLEQLQRNPFYKSNDERDGRCTGLALNVAISLLEASYINCPCRVMIFSSGPCTVGLGMIVDRPLRQPIRSHHDIDNENAKYYKKGCKYYQELSQRASNAGQIIDIFGGCYDQIGLDEMKTLTNSTGGVIIQTDSFTTSIFKQSFIRLFSRDDDDGGGNLKMGFLGNFQVKMSKEVKVSGLIGHASNLNKKSIHVAEVEVGMGASCAWKICGISDRSTLITLFDVVNPLQSPQQSACIQYLTYYLHSSGRYRLRVTTVLRSLSSTPHADIQQGFDQEAAASVVARLAVEKSESGLPVPEVIRWLDRLLVKLCMKFANYVTGDINSFNLRSNLSLFPQFLYHLRRGQFLQVFNNSPDETTYYRHLFNQVDTSNNLLMIQPTLTAYEIDKEPEPVLLDSLSITPERILLLDTFFHILIYYGETIASWYDAGYHDNIEEYASFAKLIEQPQQDAIELVQDRFPLPRYITTRAKGSQARFLLSKLNPSRSASGGYGESGMIVLTDDVNLQDFMQSLKKLCVENKLKP